MQCSSFRQSPTCVRSCAMWELGMQDWNGAPGTAKASSAAVHTQPASERALLPQLSRKEHHHGEGMGHTLLPNTTKHPISEETSARFLRIGARKKRGVHSVWSLLESWLRNNSFWGSHVPMHCHHCDLLYKISTLHPFQRLWKDHFRVYYSISWVISFFQVQLHCRLPFWQRAKRMKLLW